MSFNPGGGGGISSASDVSLSNPVTNQVLTYDGSTAKWKNAAGGSASATKIVITGAQPGNLIATYGQTGFIVMQNCTIDSVRAILGTALSGQSVIVDVNKNGSSIYTTQANRPTFAVGATTATTSLPNVTSLAVGDKITFDIDQIGTTVAGADLTIAVSAVPA